MELVLVLLVFPVLLRDGVQLGWIEGRSVLVGDEGRDDCECIPFERRGFDGPDLSVFERGGVKEDELPRIGGGDGDGGVRGSECCCCSPNRRLDEDC